MDYNKLKLKELIQIVRQAGKSEEAIKELGINSIKNAKKKPLIDFLNFVLI